MKKRILSILLMAFMIVSLMPLSVSAANTVPDTKWTDYAAKEFAGGAGTKTDPYRIETAEQLAKLAEDVSARNTHKGEYFRLETNIDLSSHRWIPIGDYGGITYDSFEGFLDGNGKTITGMVVDQSKDKRSAGLFGHISNSTAGNEVGVKDLTIKGAALYLDESKMDGPAQDISAGILCAGAMVNDSYKGTGTFENIDVSGTIEVQATNGSNKIGGLIGDDNRCVVRNCTTNVTITGPSNAGGMTGCSANTTFENCIAKGKISGLWALGGFVGYSISSTWDDKTTESTFTKCIADVEIEASDWNAGGFVGLAEFGTFKNSASYGKVTSKVDGWEPKVGGFAGGVGDTSYLENSNATFSNCHSASSVTGASKTYKAGGFAGNFEKGTFTDCSYDHEKNANLDAVGEGTTDQKVAACSTQKTLSNMCVDVYGGHKYAEEFTIDKEPTCVKDGSKSQHCTRCDEHGEAVIIPATGNHDWDSDYTIDKQPTATEDGVKSIHCKNCDAKKDVTKIPATGTAKSDSSENQTSDSSASTGDDANLALWAVVLMLSGCAAAGTVLYRRKQNSAK